MQPATRTTPAIIVDPARWPFHIASLAAALASTAGLAFASQPPTAPSDAWVEREVLDKDLNATLVRVQSLTATELIARTRDNRPIRLSLAEINALVTALPDTSGAATTQSSPRRAARPSTQASPAQRALATFASSAADASGLLLLTDGQTLAGVRERDPARLLRLAPEGFTESLAWRSSTLDTLILPLERISAVSFSSPQITIPQRMSGDMVRLRNNDLASGFVDIQYRAGDPDSVLTIEPDGGAGANGVTRRIPLRRVASIILANPPEPAAGPWVWLADDSILRLDGSSPLTLNNDRIAQFATTFNVHGDSEAGLAKRTISVNAADLIAFAPRRERLMALAERPMRVANTDTQRRWTAPPIIADALGAPLGAPDIELPGPMGVTWTLPTNAQRVAGVIELPASARAWGDCNVILLDAAGKERWSARVNNQAPRHAFNLDLTNAPTQDLTLRVDAGANGPIEDRILVRRALILLAPPAN